MSISKYQVFLKTVSCGSFSKAAEALSFTQSGISHAINSLENELGVELLSRNRGGVVLTADGRACLLETEAGFFTWRDCGQDFQNGQNGSESIGFFERQGVYTARRLQTRAVLGSAEIISLSK